MNMYIYMYVLILGDNVLSLVMRDQGIMRFVKYVYEHLNIYIYAYTYIHI
jgi:hypothetical protein